MSNRVRIVLIIVIMAIVIGASYWYMQETTGKVEVVVEMSILMETMLIRSVVYWIPQRMNMWKPISTFLQMLMLVKIFE